ncbi:DUF4236 domain-containing protein [Thermoactinospora rubra]|uniref:DUF4236 domain-containing protein n=1 Tax=Thermoactinospora rubra TaxID=1088767 RepID=UPI000A10C20E|nr:DUF4236 domain-containing protein [Thermoactinospora rubra]
MGWHYRKTIKVGPFRIHLTPRGVGHSIGGRKLHLTTTPDGRRHVTVRLPGGFHLSKTIGGRRKHYY